MATIFDDPDEQMVGHGHELDHAFEPRQSVGRPLRESQDRPEIRISEDPDLPELAG